MPRNSIDVGADHSDGTIMITIEDNFDGAGYSDWCKMTPEYARGFVRRIDAAIAAMEARTAQIGGE